MSGVSVVLPVRNGGPFFEPALRSLAEQTFTDMDIVIHVDGSTDGSLEVAEGFARRDARFLVSAGPATGVAAAANAAASRASGDLLVRMDADDIAHPTRVEKLVHLAAECPDVDLFASRVAYFPREAVGPGMERYETWLNGLLTHEEIFADRFVEYPLPHPTTAIRREAFEQLGGYRHGDFPEDYEFFLRAAAAGMRFQKHPDVLLDWREGEHRTTKTDPRYGMDRFHDVKVEHVVAHLRGLARPVAIVGAGRVGKRWVRSLRANDVVLTTFVDAHPGRIGQTIQGLPVVGHDELPRASVLLCTAARPEARAALRERLVADDLVEDRDFLFVV